MSGPLAVLPGKSAPGGEAGGIGGKESMTRIPAASSGEETFFAALELSKNGWLLAIQFPERDNPSRHPITAGDAEGLMAKHDAARKRLTKVSGQAPKVRLCYEAGHDGFWLTRFLEQRGIA